jgi:hypothetical protein
MHATRSFSKQFEVIIYVDEKSKEEGNDSAGIAAATHRWKAQ